MKTQNLRVLAYLKAHKRIDSYKALTDLGVGRLAARIHELRQEGHNITSFPKRMTNRYRESVIISEYRLN